MNYKCELGKLVSTIKRIENYFEKEYIKSKFKAIGNNVYIGNNCVFTENTISIGNDVYIGNGCCFQSKHGEIEIGNHIMFGPGVHIHGGDHDFRKIGKYIRDNSKARNADGKVRIEDDCWIGANAIILKRVRIGKGTIIGAGAIVTKDIPEYSIYIGHSNQRIMKRFNEDEIKAHQEILKKKGGQ